MYFSIFVVCTCTLAKFVTAYNLTENFAGQEPPTEAFQQLSQSTLPSGLSSCWVIALTLDVIYFPPRTATAGDSITLPVPFTSVSNGYTFSSPSVYVVYESLYAIAPGAQIADHIGGLYTSVTRAYPPGYLSTLPSGCWFGEGHLNQNWQTLQVEDLQNPPQNWQSSTKCEAPDDFDDFGGPNGTKMAASPLVSLPADIRTYDPLWAECGPSPQARDPPRVLVPVEALDATTTTHLPVLGTVVASPGASTTPSTPSQTMSIAATLSAVTSPASPRHSSQPHSVSTKHDMHQQSMLRSTASQADRPNLVAALQGMDQPILTRGAHDYLGFLSPYSGHKQPRPTPHLDTEILYLEISKDTMFSYRTEPQEAETDAHYGGAAAAIKHSPSVFEGFPSSLKHRPVITHSLSTRVPQDLVFEPHTTTSTGTKSRATEVASIQALQQNPSNRFRTRTEAALFPGGVFDNSIVLSISSGAAATSTLQQVRTNPYSSSRSLSSTFKYDDTTLNHLSAAITSSSEVLHAMNILQVPASNPPNEGDVSKTDININVISILATSYLSSVAAIVATSFSSLEISASIKIKSSTFPSSITPTPTIPIFRQSTALSTSDIQSPISHRATLGYNAQLRSTISSRPTALSVATTRPTSHCWKSAPPSLSVLVLVTILFGIYHDIQL